MTYPPITLTRFITAQERRIPTATGEFSDLLQNIALAGKLVAREVNRSGLVEDILGSAGTRNVHGEDVQKLDVYAHMTFVRILQESGHLAIMASEESETAIEIPREYPKGKYVLNFDPLDGSSNIDAGASIGTIFSILPRLSSEGEPSIRDCMQQGANQVGAGYLVYGASTTLVFTTGAGTHGFTLDPGIGEFILSHENIRIRSHAKYYSVNEGHSATWSTPIRRLVDTLKNGSDGNGPRSLRYIGSLVADFHRNLLKGGIFIYPSDKNNPSGKLRLLYEANPLAMIVEQAGGLATSGLTRVMDIAPEALHQRVPLIIGSPEDVELAARIHQDDATTA